MTNVAALLLGAATSLHCVGMCGPLACGLGTMSQTEGERLTAAALYHGSRLLSYGLIGGVCGALGQQPLKWFFASPAVVLPWVLVAVLLVVATGWDKNVPRPAMLDRWLMRVRGRAGKLPVYGGAAAMGLLTPLLPCGPLYLMFAAALLAGSAARGAEFTLAFGLGTIPLLWLAQHQFQRLRRQLAPRYLTYLRRGLALVAALMLGWRLHGTLPAAFYGNPPPATPADLPACCH